MNTDINTSDERMRNRIEERRLEKRVNKAPFRGPATFGLHVIISSRSSMNSIITKGHIIKTQFRGIFRPLVSHKY